ncbi:MAG TPA: peptidoglycan-binding domain-containing protein [Bosea sp. (in: a-proteobacteria)]|jgi:peptidoglycan hydrolase-like protein with peptidoglycan-binding domain|uniref:peptidoglycan-binding domain-containing protein n=1 Tax=Bosea sp. (in: a-proteobacteria) TaxID=1871050 RepID=UPI002DDCEACE|nr:peptidoglycan-binding domain-containing protein [Bosea sp. (in: a-proteobacteria)]HEV2555238.1 peptidoglycan-binding domain-containing protein [Bosea sp. (in: a-proteobacteria)]
MGKFGGPAVRYRSLRAHGKSEIPEIAPGIIKGSVGQNGKNSRSDVITVQKLLRIIGQDCGGPSSNLTIDGIIGNRTISAIKRYQNANFGASDGLVEPSKYTIRALSLGAKAVNVWNGGYAPRPVVKNTPNVTGDTPDSPLPEPIQATNAEETRANRAFKGLPNMLKMARKAALVVARAQMALRAQQGSGVRIGVQDRLSLTLMHKHFSKNTEAEPELAPYFGYVIACYKRIELEISRRMLSPEQRGFFVGVSKFEHRTQIESDNIVIAESTPGGAFGERTNAPFGCFLGPLFDTHPRMQKPLAMETVLLHEMWHWTNHQRDQPTDADDEAVERYPSGPEYADLMTPSRMRNADCFSNFACEATFGTDVLRAFRIDLRLEHARRPKVDSSGFILG